MYELNRKNWTTYANFANVYNHTTHEMIDTDITVRLYVPSWMDRDGSVSEEEEAFGYIITNILMRPGMCIYGDDIERNI